MHIEAIKEVLAQTMNKYFQFSNNTMLLKTVVPLSSQRISHALKIICYVVLS